MPADWLVATHFLMVIKGNYKDLAHHHHLSNLLSLLYSHQQQTEFDDLISALRTGDVFGENMDKFKRNRKSRNSPPRVERMESFLRERSNERILAPWWELAETSGPKIEYWSLHYSQFVLRLFVEPTKLSTNSPIDIMAWGSRDSTQNYLHVYCRDLSKSSQWYPYFFPFKRIDLAF